MSEDRIQGANSLQSWATSVQEEETRFRGFNEWMTGQANSIHEHRYRYRITSSSHIRTFKFYYRETPPFQPRVVRIYDRPTAEGPTLAPVPIVPDFPRNPDAKMPFLKPIIPTDRSFFEGKAQRRYDRGGKN